MESSMPFAFDTPLKEFAPPKKHTALVEMHENQLCSGQGRPSGRKAHLLRASVNVTGIESNANLALVLYIGRGNEKEHYGIPYMLADMLLMCNKK